ncbi:YicC/YloC family endoribonuclease [Desulfobaculum bizertense]|uniref:TIGR00255 family protein n=1 Tax=Desulfobaculum bizertense DSM 18034 TaxID=1121442 RepID=A0A1T4WH36_9BACT|nr:YicC/YloC family endoribonuclease [Desulfobaculum bizertense]UIJ36633.1 YicC family protein [Desulfobaculum bizertense]SKA76268.1 TIGR00255 family protein [Desulfobaculum bizertense DSM 18034]
MTIKSMTGFGRHTARTEDWAQAWEIRSVNGRHLDLKWRIPSSVRSLETSFEKTFRDYATRGRINVQLNLQVFRPEILGVTLNTTLASAMLDQLQGFAQEKGADFTPDFMRLMSMSFLWEDSSSEPDPKLSDDLKQGLIKALEDWNAARATEGEAMRADLLERVARLRVWLTKLEERTPQVKETRFETIEKRMQTVLDKYELTLDQDRLLQEIAVISDKIDVTEELTRLEAHLTQLKKVLSDGGEMGKRLDFVLQECFREINTCGNKAQDTEVSRIVVDFKAELEKCREQVQNIE